MPDNPWKSVLLHLRIPFSYNLLPIFLFALAINPDDISLSSSVLLFVALHLFIYPASNGYNSYFDKDEESIGGLENPPEVSKNLYYTALCFDLIGILICLSLSVEVAAMAIIYGLVSKAYSHPLIRLKRLPLTGWMTVALFQGYFIFCMSYLAVHELELSGLMDPFVQIPAFLATLMLFGSYPMTQVYQHGEDGRRGDETISRKLGILGTFHFTALAFTVATAGYLYFFMNYLDRWAAMGYLIFLGPVLIFFTSWYLQVRKDPARADFNRTMMLNRISSTSLNLFFLILFFYGRM